MLAVVLGLGHDLDPHEAGFRSSESKKKISNFLFFPIWSPLSLASAHLSFKYQQAWLVFYLIRTRM